MSLEMFSKGADIKIKMQVVVVGTRGAEMPNNIARLRKKKGLSQYALAHKIGVSQTTIYVWEYGYRQPAPEDVERLAEVLKVSPDEILCLEESTV